MAGPGGSCVFVWFEAPPPLPPDAVFRSGRTGSQSPGSGGGGRPIPRILSRLSDDRHSNGCEVTLHHAWGPEARCALRGCPRRPAERPPWKSVCSAPGSSRRRQARAEPKRNQACAQERAVGVGTGRLRPAGPARSGEPMPGATAGVDGTARRWEIGRERFQVLLPRPNSGNDVGRLGDLLDRGPRLALNL